MIIKILSPPLVEYYRLLSVSQRDESIVYELTRHGLEDPTADIIPLWRIEYIPNKTTTHPITVEFHVGFEYLDQPHTGILSITKLPKCNDYFLYGEHIVAEELAAPRIV